MAALRFATFRWVFKASGELDLLQCNGHIKANFRWQLFLTACLRVCSLCSEPDLCFIKKRNTIGRMNDDSLSLLPRSVKRNFPLILSKTYSNLKDVHSLTLLHRPKNSGWASLTAGVGLPHEDLLGILCFLSEVKRPEWSKVSLRRGSRSPGPEASSRCSPPSPPLSVIGASTSLGLWTAAARYKSYINRNRLLTL